MRKLFILGLLITIISCQNRFDSEIKREIQVINDVYLQLSEEISFCINNFPIPPPPPPKGYDYDTALYSDIMSEYESKLNKIDYDTSIVIIALYDTLINKYWDIKNIRLQSDDSIFREYLPILNSLKDAEKEPYLINIKSITETGKYKLRPYHKFPTGKKSLRKEYDFNFGGVLLLSRIYFNEKYNKALFYCDYACRVDGARGYVILLEKVNFRWIIIDKQMVSIS